ncbi:MAG: secretin N-terminal domain-containing protein, partial [Leptospiraceae bacterium]|nr:secretin N-terminal domain-containing protein [Leptospiraceae bacterium]
PDFRDQEIQDFLKAMSAIIGKNFVTDDRVKGKITVISPRRIPISEAEYYLRSVLMVRGFGLIEEGPNLVRVVPVRDAIAGSPWIALGREPLSAEEIKEDKVITHIVPLIGSKPSRMAPVLKRLTGPNTDIVDFDESEMIVITGSVYEVNRLVRIVGMIDIARKKEEKEEEPTSLGNVHIYRLEHMQAENVEQTLRKVSIPVEMEKKDAQQQGQIQRKNIDIVAHKETNTLIFVGTREEYELVRGLIKRIDLPRDQVLLEVLIVEVAADDANSFGIDWRVGRGATAQFNTGLAAEGNLINNKGEITGINTLLGFSLTVIDRTVTDILGLINANIRRENFAIISAPQVLTLDNQEAEINVGEDIPIITGSRLAGAADQTVQTFQYEYRPVGVKLKFTPQINKNKMVTLNLYQEVKAISGATQDALANPKFSKRDIKTVVRVEDGQTIVIGGLVSTDKTRNVRKIPILGDIPLLGYLFKRTSLTLKKTNLLVFITPHILTSRKVADKVTEDLKKDQQREFLQRERGE